MIDHDGNGKYSGTEAVTINRTISGLKILPNPVRSQAIVQFNAMSNERAEIQLVNAEGKMMQSRAVNCNAGFNQAVLMIPANYASGVYVARITTASGHLQAKVLVQRD